MPSLTRFVLFLGLIGGIAAMFALVSAVEVHPREIVLAVPQESMTKRRTGSAMPSTRLRRPRPSDSRRRSPIAWRTSWKACRFPTDAGTRSVPRRSFRSGGAASIARL